MHNNHNTNKDFPAYLDAFERDSWQPLDFGEQIEQFSMGDDVISPLNSYCKDPQKNDSSRGGVAFQS